MATMARIENGKVMEVLSADPFPPFHPDLVWVDCSATLGVTSGWAYDGSAFAAPVPPAPVEADYVAAAQALLNTTARSRGYDDILSLTSYVDDPNPTFSAEAAAGKSWRSAVWTAGYALLAQVQAGTITAPTIESFVASLPAMVWPS
jgi:hypothetical protein